MEVNLETIRTNRFELGIPLSQTPYFSIYRDKLKNPQSSFQKLDSFPNYCFFKYKIHNIADPKALEDNLNIKWTKYKNKLESPCKGMIYEKCGKFYILDGHHRMGLALARGQKNIQSVVIKKEIDYLKWQNLIELDYPDFNFTDQDWKNFYDDAFKIYGMKKLYHYIPLDYFKDWSLERKVYRRKIIKQICLNQARILDLGCNIGGMDFDIFDNNRIVGVDNNPQNIKVARKLTFIFDKPIIFFHRDILDFLENPGHEMFKHFDLIICTSILHHVRRDSEERFRKILSLLKKRGSKLLFDFAEKGEKTIFPQEFRLSPEEIQDTIFRFSGYQKSTIVDLDPQFGRHLFLFE